MRFIFQTIRCLTIQCEKNSAVGLSIRWQPFETETFKLAMQRLFTIRPATVKIILQLPM